MVVMREDKGWNDARTTPKKSEKRPLNLCIQMLDHFDEQMLTEQLCLIYALKQS